MKTAVFLSHAIEPVTPVFGGTAAPSILPVKSLGKGGDTSNTYRLTLENHWGTHMDCPNHFFNEGMPVADLAADAFVFLHPELVDVTLGENEILGLTGEITSIAKNTDLVLLRSDWGKFRRQEKYVKRNPGLSPEVGTFLRSERPSVRAVGIDWISVSAFADRETGRRAHRTFLDPEGQGHPVLLIEDMLLPADLAALTMVVAAPLRVRGVDSAPCTVIGYGDA